MCQDSCPQTWFEGYSIKLLLPQNNDEKIEMEIIPFSQCLNEHKVKPYYGKKKKLF